MKIQHLRDYAQKLAGLPPNDKCPVLTPSQLSPDAHPEADRIFYMSLGRVCVHFLNSRKKYDNR